MIGSSQLLKNAEFIQRVLESSQDCIKVLDLDGRLMYMNDGGQKVMEIDDFLGTVKGVPWLEFWGGEAREAAQSAFNEARQGRAGQFDGFCATAKGSPRWWEVAVTPIFNEQHDVTEILSVSRDITARKNAELALKARNQELDRFASVVSHDLKAPLRGVCSLTEWIVEDLDPTTVSSEVQESLTLLQNRVQRMSHLVDGLLQVARTGRSEVPAESVDVAELLSEVLEAIALPKTFKIIHATALPTKLVARRLLLTQVFSNCLSNAHKHHDKESGQIEISAQEKGSHYEFSIADDGPGIPEEMRDRVFKMFQTLGPDSTSTTNTGIGLALIEKIITAEGGKLWLEPHTPRGCKFCFTWPKAAI